MTDLADRVVTAARSYLGVRWHHMGRSRQGMDCAGLVQLAYADAGIELEDSASYERGHRSDAMLTLIAGQGRRVPIDATADGDVLLFADGLYVCHVGIRATWHGGPSVVHAKLARRMVTEDPLTGVEWRQLRAAYRHPALEA